MEPVLHYLTYRSIRSHSSRSQQLVSPVYRQSSPRGQHRILIDRPEKSGSLCIETLPSRLPTPAPKLHLWSPGDASGRAFSDWGGGHEINFHFQGKLIKQRPRTAHAGATTGALLVPGSSAVAGDPP